jgi:formylglycine-generating enzyme required for sulfatase activity
VDAAWKNPGVAQGDTHPVVNVSSEDAGKFCAWLTAKERGEGKIGQAQTYRLPTDSEWSWAVGIGEAEERAGKGRSPQEKDAKIGAGSHPWAYPWGQDWPPPKGAGNYGQSLQVDDYEHTSPVGSFGANPQGLYDLGGNVWEWVADYYDGKTGTRSLRGGSWIDGDPRYLLSSSRSLYGAGSRYSYCGFRLVLVGAAVC